MVGVVVLLGSIYLLLGTNLGIRLGFFVASAAFWGWMFMMGAVWWVYGNVGMLGTAPHWVVVETVYPGVQESGVHDVTELDTEALPSADEYADLEEDALLELADSVEDDLGGWVLLPESDASFGEAKATVDEHFSEHPDEELEVDGPEDYITTFSFERGGKEGLPDDPDRLDRIWHKLKSIFWEVRHPPHYAIVQVQPVIEQETEPGQAPPAPRADETKDVISVVLKRDLGDVRFPAAMLTIGSGAMFAVMCVTLHRRDQQVAKARGLLPATTEG
jgi:hypothetical protein